MIKILIYDNGDPNAGLVDCRINSAHIVGIVAIGENKEHRAIITIGPTFITPSKLSEIDKLISLANEKTFH